MQTSGYLLADNPANSFFYLLTGLHVPDAGRIFVDDTQLSELDIRKWRRMIGYVPQELALLHDTVLLNVTLGDETLSDDQLFSAMVENPILIERPIVVKNSRAVIGRPPENVLELLD